VDHRDARRTRRRSGVLLWPGGQRERQRRDLARVGDDAEADPTLQRQALGTWLDGIEAGDSGDQARFCLGTYVHTRLAVRLLPDGTAVGVQRVPGERIRCRQRCDRGEKVEDAGSTPAHLRVIAAKEGA
jgi:hypothetical protein